MINDISEILNFRYHKKFLSQEWYDGQNPERFSDYEKLLREPPHVYNHFKYVLHENFGIKINKQLKNRDVFCYTNNTSMLVELTNEYPDNFANLVIMGDDRHLSGNLDLLNSIKHHFKKIYYEAKNVKCDWIQTLPMGMISAYMVRNGGNEILHHINKQKSKTKLVASAFGSKWPRLTNMIKDRTTLQAFTKDNDFVDDIFCDPQEYYERLCEYKFFLAPLGNGIQTPKICECFMCETVLVVTDHVAHQELRDLYDLPLLIVNEWSDLTEEFLNDQWCSVYSKIDWNEQKNKFLVKNFDKLLKGYKFRD